MPLLHTPASPASQPDLSDNAVSARAGLQEDVQALSDMVRRFTQDEIAPHINQWDEAGEFPRALYGRAASLGLLGLGYPESLGGTPAAFALRNAVSVTMSRHAGSGGLMASLFSLNIGLPPVLRYASEALKQAVIPPVLRGEKIAALAITEPGGGSDVAGLRTTAHRDGGDYVVSGEKVFITSGMRADWITMAVRTGEAGSKGAGGISMLLVPGDAAGLSRSPLQKMGWWCSDTAHLRMDGVRVPAANLLGEEGGERNEVARLDGTHRVGEFGQRDDGEESAVLDDLDQLVAQHRRAGERQRWQHDAPEQAKPAVAKRHAGFDGRTRLRGPGRAQDLGHVGRVVDRER